MLTTLKAGARLKAIYPLRYAVDLLTATVSSPSPLRRILIVSDGASFTSEQQFAPLLLNRSHLRRHLGVVLDYRRIDSLSIAPLKTLSRYNAVIAKLGFSTPEPTAIAIVKTLKQNCGGAKLIYFDGDDDLCVQWGGILEFVDLYVKKQVFADPHCYLRSFIGKSNLTDYIARTHGRSFKTNPIPISGFVDARQLHKVVLGYNVACDQKIVRLFKTRQFVSQSPKDIDIVCRANALPEDWLLPFRQPIRQALANLCSSYNVILPQEKVSQRQYDSELSRSRICVSPFGYGEICWRDFEAIICGALLVKPNMSHLRTEPDVFVPGETYVPVKWDFSDLADVCTRYLRDQTAITRITQRAYDKLAKYYERLGAIGRFQRLLAMVGLMPRGGQSENKAYHSGAGYDV